MVVKNHDVIHFRPNKRRQTMPITKEVEEVILVIGSKGGDGGYSVVTSHGIKKVPSNNPEARAAFDAIATSYAKLQAIAGKEQAGVQAGR
jgi:hypothetical protein